MYETPSNKLSHDMYDNLPMPWDVKPPIAAFPRGGYSRYEWNRNGTLKDGEVDFFGGGEEVTLDELRKQLGTASMVTRWREANVGTAGTERDCVELTIGGIVSALGSSEADTSKLKLKIGSATTLLVFVRM
jgi:trans-aconitate 3-methyltransferase